MWQAWTDGILGLWLALAPLLSMDVPSVKLNNIFVGLVVAVVGWYVPKERGWQRWVTETLGYWVLIASFIPDLVEGYPYLWNNLVSGILIAVGGFTMLHKNTILRKI